MSKVNAVISAIFGVLGNLADQVAGLPPGELANEIGVVVTALVTLGYLHVTNASAFDNAVAGLVLAAVALGVAIERAVKASK